MDDWGLIAISSVHGHQCLPIYLL